MMRLIIAVATGLVLAVLAVVIVANVLSNYANGTPSNGTLYVHGTP